MCPLPASTFRARKKLERVSPRAFNLDKSRVSVYKLYIKPKNNENEYGITYDYCSPYIIRYYL